MESDEVSTISEAVEWIVNAIKDNDKMDFVKSYSDVSRLAVTIHATFGRTIRNELKLWNRHSDLHNAIKNKVGLVHADDQCGYLLRLVWNEITENEVDIDSWLNEIDEYWNTMNLPEYGPKT